MEQMAYLEEIEEDFKVLDCCVDLLAQKRIKSNEDVFHAICKHFIENNPKRFIKPRARDKILIFLRKLIIKYWEDD